MGSRCYLLQHSRHLYHHTHTTSSIICCKDWLVPIIRVRIVICPRARIVMGAEEYPCGKLRTILCHDIRSMQHRTVITFQIDLLRHDLASILLEFPNDPIPTSIVSWRVHRTGPEVALRLDKGISRIGIKVEGYPVSFCLILFFPGSRFYFFSTICKITPPVNGEANNGSHQAYQSYFHSFCHLCFHLFCFTD